MLSFNLKQFTIDLIITTSFIAFLLVMSTLINKSYANEVGYNPSKILDAKNEKECIEYIESLDISEDIDTDYLNDQCYDQAYSTEKESL